MASGSSLAAIKRAAISFVMSRNRRRLSLFSQALLRKDSISQQMENGLPTLLIPKARSGAARSMARKGCNLQALQCTSAYLGGRRTGDELCSWVNIRGNHGAYSWCEQMAAHWSGLRMEKTAPVSIPRGRRTETRLRSVVLRKTSCNRHGT